MASRKGATHIDPTLPPDRALRALAQQLDRLQKLKDRSCEEADAEETEWEHLTQSIIEGAFGNPSSSLNHFFGARFAGQHNLMGISPQQRQTNFELRIKEYEALLKASIETLRLQLPEEEIKGAYAPGNEYEFYRDLSSLIQVATNDIFFVDAYLDEQLFNLYVSKVSANTKVRILSTNIGANVEAVARMYVKNRPLKMRSSQNVHDRVVFIDQRGWVTGQSIKDAARKKPTYLIELDEPTLSSVRDIHEQIWTAAKVII